MNVVVITSADAINLDAFFAALAESLSDSGVNCAFLDGRALGWCVPVDFPDRSLIVQDNLCSCARNYADAGARYAFAWYAFSSQREIDDIGRKLRDAGHGVLVVGLVAQGAVLAERYRREHADEAPADGIESVTTCDTRIRNLHGIEVLDTSGLSMKETALDVLHLIGTDDNFSFARKVQGTTI